MRSRAILLCAILALFLAGCGSASETFPAAASQVPAPAGSALPAKESSRSFFAMDTYMTVRAYGADEALLDEAEAWVGELEARISVTREESELYAINRTGEGRLSAEAAALLRGALSLCGETGGALDVTIYPVVRAWGFTTGEYRVPENEELQRLLRYVDYRLVRISEDGEVSVPVGMQLDLGSIAKGYTGDMLCGLLRSGGVKSALLDLGGNIQAVGGKPDGSAWRVGIRDPIGDGLLGVLPVRDRAVITSGGYERYFEDADGNLWWHIMDPATGTPVRNGLISVTVVGESGLACDALSTALFVMGQDRAAAYWREHSDFEMILVTEDGRLLMTPDLAQQFVPSENLSYRVEEIERA